MRLLVTRPEPQAADWVERLAARGIDAVALPLIEIAPPADHGAVADAWASLPQQSLVLFVSPNAALRFVAARPDGAPWPPALQAAAVGPGTARTLAADGIARIVEPAADAAQFDSEALWELLRRSDWRGHSVLVVRGEGGGRDWLADRLAEAGAAVRAVAAYARRAPRFEGAAARLLRDAIDAPSKHCWLFSSSLAIDHLAAASRDADWSRAHAIATHPRIAARAHTLGIADAIETRASFDAVLSAALRCIQSIAP